MSETKTRGVRVPDALMHLARTALGLPETARESDVVRAALAHAAEVDVAAYIPRRGWPVGVSRAEMASKASRV